MDARMIVRLLREARERAGLSQAAVAEAAGVSSETVSRIEREQNEPELSTAIAMARALGFEIRLTGPDVPKELREVDAHLPLVVTQLAARTVLLDATAQKALLRLAELLPVKPRK